jgi:thioredoxin reductase (NADPH)
MTDPSPQHEPLPETPDAYGAFPRLDDPQIQRLAIAGERRETHVGQVLYAEGEPTEEFFVILSGSVAIVTGLPHDERILRVHGPRRFLGELGLLEGQPSFVSAVVTEPGEVMVLGVNQLRETVAHDPVLGDIILRSYLIRRSLMIGEGTGLRIVGSCYSPDTRRLLDFSARNRLPHRLLDLDKDTQADALLIKFGIEVDETPVVILRGSEILRNPGNADLAQRLGLREPAEGTIACDLLVVGAGPGGLAASVYGASEGFSVLTLDAVATGGQASTSSRIENYLGFPSGISGADLAERSRLQASKFGAQISVPAQVTSLEARGGEYVAGFEDGSEVTAKSVVLATGARYRKLAVPRIEDFESTCVYYAATQHEAKSCPSAPVVVVGGGNSAGQATVFLADKVPKVYLAVRSDDLAQDMSRYLVDQIERNPRVEVMLHTEVKELVGDHDLRAVVVEDNQTGQRRVLEAKSLFVFIGAEPCTSWLEGLLALDANGFVLTGMDAQRELDGDLWRHVGRTPMTLETSRPGVFAVGDVRSGSTKRVASAVGDGAMAVRFVHEHFQHAADAVVRDN